MQGTQIRSLVRQPKTLHVTSQKEKKKISSDWAFGISSKLKLHITLFYLLEVEKYLLDSWEDEMIIEIYLVFSELNMFHVNIAGSNHWLHLNFGHWSAFKTKNKLIKDKTVRVNHSSLKALFPRYWSSSLGRGQNPSITCSVQLKSTLACRCNGQFLCSVPWQAWGLFPQEDVNVCL